MEHSFIKKLIDSENSADSILAFELIKALNEEELLDLFHSVGLSSPDEITIFRYIRFQNKILTEYKGDLLFKIGEYYLYPAGDKLYLDNETTFQLTPYRNKKIVQL